MIKKLVKKIIDWATSEQPDELILSRGSQPVAQTIRDNELRTEGMVFHLYPANGGTVIETIMYDRKKDERICELYIITENEDFTATLGQIISMERIKKWH